MNFVCVRVDDFLRPTPAMKNCIEGFLERGVSVHVATIPAALTTEGAQYLSQLNKRFGASVEIGQHGFRHEERRSASRRFEVGPGMAYGTQRQIVEAGREALRRKLGRPAAPVFVPPFNGFDRTTLRVLADLGFEVISAEERQPILSTSGRLVEVSANLDALWGYEPPLRKPLAEIVRAVRQVCRRRPFVVLLLHPDLAALSESEVDRLAKALMSDGMRPTTLQDMANELRCRKSRSAGRRGR